MNAKNVFFQEVVLPHFDMKIGERSHSVDFSKQNQAVMALANAVALMSMSSEKVQEIYQSFYSDMGAVLEELRIPTSKLKVFGDFQYLSGNDSYHDMALYEGKVAFKKRLNELTNSDLVPEVTNGLTSNQFFDGILYRDRDVSELNGHVIVRAATDKEQRVATYRLVTLTGATEAYDRVARTSRIESSFSGRSEAQVELEHVRPQLIFDELISFSIDSQEKLEFFGSDKLTKLLVANREYIQTTVASLPKSEASVAPEIAQNVTIPTSEPKTHSDPAIIDQVPELPPEKVELEEGDVLEASVEQNPEIEESHFWREKVEKSPEPEFPPEKWVDEEERGEGVEPSFF